MFSEISFRAAEPRFRPLVNALKPWVLETLRYRHAPRDLSFELRLVSLPEMHRLHLCHKGRDRPTDVLSFVDGVDQGIDICGSFPGGVVEEGDRGEKPFLSFVDELGPAERRQAVMDRGSIVICPDYLTTMKARYPFAVMPLEPYCLCTAVHGTLHLLGYNHEETGEYLRMRQAEQRTMRYLYRQRQLGRLPPLPINANQNCKKK